MRRACRRREVARFRIVGDAFAKKRVEQVLRLILAGPRNVRRPHVTICRRLGNIARYADRIARRQLAVHCGERVHRRPRIVFPLL